MLTDWILRLRSLVKRDAVEQELDDELRFHVEQLVQSHMRQGCARDEAVRRARIAFGGLDEIKEEHRHARGIGVASDLGADVRYGFRQFRRAPGFAVLAVLCLGLGIGVNTAIFGVINAVILRPMPVAEPERLVVVGRAAGPTWSYPAYRDVRARTRVLSGLAVALPMESDLDVDGESSFVAAEAVSANYADVLGLTPSPGRWFVDDREPAAVISHAVWERRFDLSPDVIGRLIRSGSESYTIVGVAPREYSGVFAPMRTDLWVPIQSRPRLAAQLEEGGLRGGLKLFGRLREDATAAQASAELNAIDAQLTTGPGRSPEIQSPIAAEPARAIPDSGMRRRVGIFTTLLAAVVGLVLLIACVNVGNLLLVRGALRQREFAVRRALGASRFRLLRQLLTESLLLGAGGGICGVIFAVWANKALETSVPPFLGAFAFQLDLSLDWRVVAFATIVALAATILCGLLPAWRTSRARGLVAFKGEIGGGPPRRRPLGLVAQVVMSLVLLFVAGSFLQALQRLYATDPGFEVAGRLYAYTSLPSSTLAPEGRRELYALALQRLRALPGVRTAALTSSLPLMPTGSDCVSGPAGTQIPATASGVDAGYFETMGIGIVSGRDFVTGDFSSGAATVILNESLARRIWPEGPQLPKRPTPNSQTGQLGAAGQVITIGCKDPQPAVVAGIVRNSAISSLDDPASQPHLYRPIALRDVGGLTVLVLDASADPAAMVLPVRRTLLALGQAIRVYTVQPLGTHIEQRYAPFRWLSRVLTGFGVLALGLAAIGLYGVIAYRVALRTQEIGVRMALGARRIDIFREVLTHGLAIVLVGVAIGELLTAVLTGVAGSIQEGIGATAVGTHVAVALIWIAIALCACFLPAARAARVDPMVALRHD